MANHLASFVATVLKDDAVADVLKEHEQWKSKAALLEITGEGGTPVYASRDIREGTPGGAGSRWIVEMTQIQECPLENLGTVQIRLGGVPLLEGDDLIQGEVWLLDLMPDLIPPEESFIEEDGYGLFSFKGPWDRDRGCVGDIVAHCGPFENYLHYSNQGLDILNNDELFRGLHMADLGAENPQMGIRFVYGELRLPKMLDCLARFGISREKATGQEPNNPEG